MADHTTKVKEYLERANWTDLKGMNQLFWELNDECDRDESFPYRKVLIDIENLDYIAAGIHFPKGKRTRREYRNLGDFGEHLRSGHILERRIKAFFMKHYAHYLDGRDLIQFGVEESGALIIKGEGIQIERPDTKFDIPHPKYGNYMELKSNKYCNWKWTYKIDNLRQYQKDRASMLSAHVKYGDVKMFHIIDPTEIDRLLEKTQHFAPFEKECGGKNGIQLYWGLTPEQVKQKQDDGVLSGLALPLVDFCSVIVQHKEV